MDLAEVAGIMWAWLVKLVGGWLPIGTKPFPEWAGKIIWAVGIVLMVSMATNVWEKFFPAKPSTQIQQVGTYYAEPKPDVLGVGCNLWRAYIKAGIRQR